MKLTTVSNVARMNLSGIMFSDTFYLRVVYGELSTNI